MLFWKMIRDTILTLRLLRQENECSLSYLPGIKANEIDHVKGNVKRQYYRTRWIRRFLARIKKQSSSRCARPKVAPLLFVSASHNQHSAMAATIAATAKRGLAYNVVSTAKAAEADANAYRATFGPSVILVATVVYLMRHKKLIQRLKANNNEAGLTTFFTDFVLAYAYIPYFIHVIRKARPELIVQANDHITPNRCLNMVAHHFGVKTAYMQHASVSGLFPPLRHDYAFLDGEASLAIYRQCESNLPHYRQEPNVNGLTVLLSGQKKTVMAAHQAINDRADIGIATNLLDDVSRVVRLLVYLEHNGVSTLVRWHPRQSREFVNVVTAIAHACDCISLSDPSEVGIPAFFGGCSALVSGNSSIHLEAALAGLPTYYYEMNDVVQTPDYYGYVKNGVSVPLEKLSDIDRVTRGDNAPDNPKRARALKYYSETYGTQWEEREGTLVAEALDRLLSGKPLAPTFSVVQSDDLYADVYKL